MPSDAPPPNGSSSRVHGPATRRPSSRSVRSTRPGARACVAGLLGPAVRRKVSVADVLQEAWITAHDRLAEFEPRGDGAFGAWLARIAEWKAREAVRRFAGTARRDARREVSRGGRPDTAVAAAADGPSPSGVASARERSERVLRALDRLEPDHRQVIRLVQLDGLRIAEAAELMGRSRDATKKLYGRALARLADVLGAEGDA